MPFDRADFKRIKHYHEPGDLHEFTFSCYAGLPLLTNRPWRLNLSRAIESACQHCSMELVAFVYMPEHVHLLTLPTCTSPNIPLFLACIKEPVSAQAKKDLIESNSPLLKRLTIRERIGKRVFRFWQEGPGYDRNLYQPKTIEASIAYIHNNPVRRGLCKLAVQYDWSSARYYLLDPPKQQFPELPFIHGLHADALGST